MRHRSPLPVAPITLALAFAAAALLAACADGTGLEPDLSGSADAGAAGGGPGGGAGGAGGATGGTGGGRVDGGVVCGPVCAIFCPHGNVTDERGCPTCTCRPEPKPTPTCPAATRKPCPAGSAYAKDAQGCEIGECRPIACTKEECGPSPRSPTQTCPDGSTAGPVCGRTADGACGWKVTTCPAIPGACGSDECGPAPTDAPLCRDGSAASRTCVRDVSGRCAWGLSCNPACTKEECAAAPPPPPVACATGPAVTRCERTVQGVCLLIPGCGAPAPTCSPESCAKLPVPDLGCPPNRVQRTSCAAQPGGSCGWSVTCEAVTPAPPACAASRDRASCEKNATCRWLEPGCGDPKLPVAGCYERKEIGCAPGRTCSGGRQCLTRVINPCLPAAGGASCDACGTTVSLCL